MFLYYCRFLIVFLLTGLICPVFAQPDLSKPLGTTIADTGSKFYRFEKFELDSEDKERHYRIVVAIPKAETPEKGFPVIYLLDGNSVLAALNDELFSRLEIPFPVIVAVGYQTDLRFDVVSRAFDYTPVLPDGSKPKDDRGRKGGGADLFAEFIETKIKPKTESFVQINKHRQTIWGHSYGGLFVLNTLFKHPEMFQNYVAAEPSFWWENGVILKIAEQFAEQTAQTGVGIKELSLAVFVGRGSLPQQRNKNRSDIRRSVPFDTVENLVKRLTPMLKVVTFHVFEDLTHGELFPVSIEPALKFSQ
jgi:predicted alpha/beta superfamily hydrolase